MFSLDDYTLGLHYIESSDYLNDLRFTSGYYREINDYHTRQTFTLIQSTRLYPALKAALEYYIRNKNNFKKSEKVFLHIRLTDNSDSYVKIFIDTSLDINLIKDYLSEEELNNIRELLMELKLSK